MFSSISDWVGDDHLLRLALAVAAISVLVTLALLAQVLSLRALAQRQAQRRRAVIERWRPLLVAVAAGEEPTPLVPLAAADRVHLMRLWVQLQDGLRGASHDRLVVLAEQLGLAADARRWLRTAPDRRRVAALALLAHVARSDDAPALRQLIDDHQPEVSLLAARALLRVQPEACALVLDRYRVRSDWPLAQMGSLLRRAEWPDRGALLAERLEAAGADELLRLLPLVQVVQSPQTDAALLRLLSRSTDAEGLAAAVALIRTPAGIERVRQLCRHDDWRVRAAAAQALGRVGGDDDRKTLVALLSDPQWWVRYRSAKALLQLPGFDAVSVQALLAGLRDRFARDILVQVVAESRLQAADVPA